jgi:hypothetical protein
MSIFLLLRAYASSFFHRFGWAGLAIALGIHVVTAYLGLVLLGEQHLTLPATFTYFYLTTTLTVGYGDLAPQTSAVGNLYTQMKERHNATLIGYRAKGARQPSINPPGATRIQGGELFYIASTRLKEIANGMV